MVKKHLNKRMLRKYRGQKERTAKNKIKKQEKHKIAHPKDIKKSV